MLKLLIIFLGTATLAYLSERYYPLTAREKDGSHHFLRDKTDPFSISIIVWMTLFNGLKTYYNDTGNYILYFRDSATTLVEHFASSNELELTNNPLYYICQVLCKGLIDNYHVWFILVALFNTVVVVKFLKHYSSNFFMTMVIYHALGTYLMYVAAMKQCIAVGILLIAIPYLLQRKWIRYYLFVFLAILFHTHAFLFLAVPLFLSKPWSKFTYLCIGTVIFAMATYDQTLGAFMEYAQSIGANVAEIEVFDNFTISPLRIAVYAIIPLFTWLFKGKLFSNTNLTVNLFVNWAILSFLILSIGLVNGANLFARMAGYFELGIALVLPWIIERLFSMRSRISINLIATLCFACYFILDLKITKGFTDSTYRSISFFEFIKSLFQS